MVLLDFCLAGPVWGGNCRREWDLTLAHCSWAEKLLKLQLYALSVLRSTSSPLSSSSAIPPATGAYPLPSPLSTSSRVHPPLSNSARVASRSSPFVSALVLISAARPSRCEKGRTWEVEVREEPGEDGDGAVEPESAGGGDGLETG